MNKKVPQSQTSDTTEQLETSGSSKNVQNISIESSVNDSDGFHLNKQITPEKSKSMEISHEKETESSESEQILSDQVLKQILDDTCKIQDNTVSIIFLRNPLVRRCFDILIRSVHRLLLWGVV